MSSPHISRPVLWFFRRIVRGYFRRNFHAVRISNASHMAAFADSRLILYANHSSWWDPMVLVLLGEKTMPTRQHYAPIDASALERYGIFKRLGMFGVEMKTARGAAGFLRTGHSILDEGGVLWVTPQGRFADNRERPLAFKPGLAALAARSKEPVTVLPLAIEYTFWDERLPETLLQFGEPVHVTNQSADELQAELEAALLRTMESLRSQALARNPAAFSIVQNGTVGTGGFYEIGQRLKALVGRRSFQPEHTAVPMPAPQEDRG
jgi:1-acyl-sn-glycerol-3-phosphate acyltransferase